MKKRVLAAMLAAALMTGVAGCAAPAQEGSSSSEASKAESSAAESSKEESKEESTESSAVETGGTAKFDDVKLKLLSCWNGGMKLASDQYNNEVAKTIRDKIGVTVEFEGIMMSETEKLNLMFASGDMPDMINAPYWGGSGGETAVIKKAGREGRLIDIKDMVPKYENIKMAYDIGVISQKFLENDVDDPSFNGARYVLPTQSPSGSVESITNWAYGVFVRGDVPEALGIDATSIKTTDQLYDFMKKAQEHGFKDVNGNDTIVATTYHDSWDLTGYQMNFVRKVISDDYILNDDGTVQFNKLTDNWIDKNLFVWKLVNEGIMDKECFKHTDAQADEKVGNGTALFASAQYGTVINSTKLTGLYNSNPEMRYTWVGPLNYVGGEALTSNATEGRNGTPALIFPTTCSNIDAALTWVDYLNSEEGARLSQYGIEGDTYEMNDKGQPRMVSALSERYKLDEESVKQELREKGISYMHGSALLADKRREWWGEQDAFEEDALDPMLKEYRTIRKVEILPGYPVDGLATSFDRYAEVSEFAFEGTTERDYRERAYFAATEDEAKQILTDYQNYLTTQKDGLFNEFLTYMGEAAKTKDNVAN